MVEALRVLFEELAKEPTFLDAWIHTSEDEPDLVVVYERWKETKDSFVRNILPKPFYQPYEAVLNRVGGERTAHVLETRYAWRA